MRDSDDMNICADSRQNKQSDFVFHFFVDVLTLNRMDCLLASS